MITHPGRRNVVLCKGSPRNSAEMEFLMVFAKNSAEVCKTLCVTEIIKITPNPAKFFEFMSKDVSVAGFSTSSSVPTVAACVPTVAILLAVVDFSSANGTIMS